MGVIPFHERLCLRRHIPNNKHTSLISSQTSSNSFVVIFPSSECAITFLKYFILEISAPGLISDLLGRWSWIFIVLKFLIRHTIKVTSNSSEDTGVASVKVKCLFYVHITEYLYSMIFNYSSYFMEGFMLVSTFKCGNISSLIFGCCMNISCCSYFMTLILRCKVRSIIADLVFVFLFISPDKQLLNTFKIGNSYSLQKFDIIYDFILI